MGPGDVAGAEGHVPGLAVVPARFRILPSPTGDLEVVAGDGEESGAAIEDEIHKLAVVGLARHEPGQILLGEAGQERVQKGGEETLGVGFRSQHYAQTAAIDDLRKKGVKKYRESL